jgi:hypothetical protein
MPDFVEIKHKRRKVILNLDQICAIEESNGSGDLLIRCSNAEDYLVERAESGKILVALKNRKVRERSNGPIEQLGL